MPDSKPTQNAIIESFKGRLRCELLNETLFTSLQHARELLAIWAVDYKNIRPHSGVGNIPPAIYAKLSDSVASPSQLGSNVNRAPLMAD